MALSAFSGVATARAIVAAARRRVGSPDLHLDPTTGSEDITAPAYVELQFLLDHLALSWDWPFARTALELTIAGRETTLPGVFWRVSFNDPLWIVDCDGGRSRVVLADEGVFFGAMAGPAEVGRPVRFWIQKSSQTLFVDPVPSAEVAGWPFIGEFHFQPWQIPLDNVDSQPWFPWSEYLVSALAVKLALNQDDNRADKEALLAVKMMKEIRRSISEQGERTASVQLSKGVYRRPLVL